MLASEEVLESAAKDGSFDVTHWPRVLETLLARLEEIVRNEFPIPPIILRPNGAANEPVTHQPQSQPQPPAPSNTLSSSPPLLPSSSFPAPSQPAEPTPSTQPPASISLPDGTLPPSLLATLTYIKKSLSSNFVAYPPHTIQRLAELILHPKQHYNFLHSYLNALDRVVSVSSPSTAFPLPGSEIAATPATDILANGIPPPTSPSTALGSDESLGGALLTPIPWLQNRRASDAGSAQEAQTNGVASSEAGENKRADDDTVMTDEEANTESSTHSMGSLREQGGITQGELLRQEQEASDPPAPVGSAQHREHVIAPARAPHVDGEGQIEVNTAAANSINDAENKETTEVMQHEVPHARGPEEIGPEDTGNVQGGGGTLDMERVMGTAPDEHDNAHDSVTAAALSIDAPATAADADEQQGGVKEGADATIGLEAQVQEAQRDSEGDVVFTDADGVTERDGEHMENTSENLASDAV